MDGTSSSYLRDDRLHGVVSLRRGTSCTGDDEVFDPLFLHLELGGFLNMTCGRRLHERPPQVDEGTMYLARRTRKIRVPTFLSSSCSQRCESNECAGTRCPMRVSLCVVGSEAVASFNPRSAAGPQPNGMLRHPGKGRSRWSLDSLPRTQPFHRSQCRGTESNRIESKSTRMSRGAPVGCVRPRCPGPPQWPT